MPDPVYKDPPPAGPIHTRITNARPHLKNIAQAASLMTATVRTVTRGADVITITGEPRLTLMSVAKPCIVGSPAPLTSHSLAAFPARQFSATTGFACRCASGSIAA